MQSGASQQYLYPLFVPQKNHQIHIIIEMYLIVGVYRRSHGIGDFGGYGGIIPYWRKRLRILYWET